MIIIIRIHLRSRVESRRHCCNRYHDVVSCGHCSWIICKTHYKYLKLTLEHANTNLDQVVWRSRQERVRKLMGLGLLPMNGSPTTGFENVAFNSATENVSTISSDQQI